MSPRFEELDRRRTPMGELVLRRRRDPLVDREVHEIKLDDEYLMSSLFVAAEEELADLALAELAGDELDVAVGGLGLGYTARTVLGGAAVRSLLVVEALAEVVEWHVRGLVPAGRELAADPRCTMARGDFFALVRSGAGLDPTDPARRFHAVLVDIDHSPRHLLHPGHADFYEPAGLRRLRDCLRPDGVFALWSNDPPDEAFLGALGTVFTRVRADVVSFHNPLQERAATNTVYLGRAAAPAEQGS